MAAVTPTLTPSTWFSVNNPDHMLNRLDPAEAVRKHKFWIQNIKKKISLATRAEMNNDTVSLEESLLFL